MQSLTDQQLVEAVVLLHLLLAEHHDAEGVAEQPHQTQRTDEVASHNLVESTKKNKQDARIETTGKHPTNNALLINF